MFSLNVPLPPAIADLATDLHPKPSGFERVRDRHTLVCKRLGVDDVPDRVAGGEPTPSKPDALEALREDPRPVLSGIGPFDVAVTGLDVFDAPASGSRPVVYLAVESERLVRLHRRLCGLYGPIEGIEGDEFTPHVTVARGGDPKPGVVADLVAAEFDPIRWRVHALEVYDPEFREVAASIDL
ncbi:2'-5' RNA ligase family protein [Halorubrum yunnanense]|uniref:2'-5' RNA ligase family protein n=1 Tax=Halorubrum yunnanense TaxID=1526162 RepID=A0ABD5YKF6_9EURY|nr:2'-5' RNA ligase family protein [Halorubrum yunnanense]